MAWSEIIRWGDLTEYKLSRQWAMAAAPPIEGQSDAQYLRWLGRVVVLGNLYLRRN